MASFFSRKKANKNVLVIDGATSTLPSITASPPPSASPQSPCQPLSPNSPMSPMPMLDSPSPALNVKKVKKRGLFSKLFKSSKSPKSPSTNPPSSSSSSMLGIFRRKEKKKTLIKNDKGEEEEREISVSITVSRIPRNTDDDEDGGLGSNDSDDILIYPIFGVPLIKILEVKQSMNNQLSSLSSSSSSSISSPVQMLALPKQIIDVCEYIRFSGLKSEGLFRVSGETGSIKEMKEKLDRGEELELTSSQLNINDLSGLFKLYWRSLPEPLFPYHFYDSLLASVDEKNWSGMELLIQQFPEPNRTIIDYLILFLGEVALYGSENRMTPMNLAVCFAPNLMRMKEEKVERVMIDAPKIIAVIQRLIETKRQFILNERQKEEEEEKIKLEMEEKIRQQKIQTKLLQKQQQEQQQILNSQQQQQQKQLLIQEELEKQKQIEIQQSIENEIEQQLIQQEKEQKDREIAARAKAKAFAEQQIAKAQELKRKINTPVILTTTPELTTAAVRVRAGSDGEVYTNNNNNNSNNNKNDSKPQVPTFFAIENNEQFHFNINASKLDKNNSSSILPPMDSSPLPVVILMPSQQTKNLTSVDQRRQWSQIGLQQQQQPRAVDDFAVAAASPFRLTVTSDDGEVTSQSLPVIKNDETEEVAENQATVIENKNSQQYNYDVDEDDDEEVGVLTIHHRSPSNSIESERDRINSSSELGIVGVSEMDEDDLIQLMNCMTISSTSPANPVHPSSSSTSSLPLWAQRQEERKRADEIAKLEASLRERAAHVEELRQKEETDRRDRMTQEKAAAKSKLSSAQQQQTTNGKIINNNENRTELSIVAERVTSGVSKPSADEFDYWTQMY